MIQAIRDKINWWKGVKRYWKVPAAVALVLAIIGVILGWVFLRCPRGTLTQEQVQEIDAMRQEMSDKRIADTEREIDESKQRSTELDAQAILHRAERRRIEREAVEIAASLKEEPDNTIAELNEWRRKNGV